MTEQDQFLLDDFKAKLRLLMKRYGRLKEDNQSCKDRLNILTEEVENLKEENEDLKKKYANLKIARAVTFSEQDSQTARQRINRIVRELDKCIAKLNV